MGRPRCLRRRDWATRLAAALDPHHSSVGTRKSDRRIEILQTSPTRGRWTPRRKELQHSSAGPIQLPPRAILTLPGTRLTAYEGALSAVLDAGPDVGGRIRCQKPFQLRQIEKIAHHP